MATLYLTDITKLPEDISPLLPLLSDSRRRRLEDLVGEKTRKRCLASGLLLRQVLGSDEVTLSAFGKPSLVDGSPFSLSHSGDYVLLAVASRPVGVDIEMHRPLPFLALATRFFAPSERTSVDSSPAFFDLWTAKESLAKMLGVGLALSMRRYALIKCESGYLCPGLPDVALATLPELPGYSITLCCEEAHDGVLTQLDFGS